ncbi:MAG: DNA-binding transcriptional regulator FrlR [Firmicutes bacterium ADurb.Bin373]|nr:GntR family transcriptional regulator [Bacillota bacterium]OQA06385.1 MAG: DNA-binding transcriptional regulator FrlR [Firmicutes bacterium ADurb.Bin373]
MESNGVSTYHMARFITIAMDMAERIASGEYHQGQKISGRSTLAALYNVSPETIRRALSLLQESDVVKVLPGTGVIVNSVSSAQEYLAESSQYKVIKGMQERLARLVQERNKINADIERLTSELLDYVLSILSAKHKI